MSKAKILVTGGTGFIGSHTTVELQAAGYDVVIVDNLSNSKASVLEGIEHITGIKPIFYQEDCTNMTAMRRIFQTEKIDGVIHFAASKAVGESVEKPNLYYRNNFVSLLNLLDIMNEEPTKGFVFSSSCTVYGEPDHNPVTEQSPIKPATSPYGNTKQVSEEIIRDAMVAGATFRSTILRYFNPIGGHPSAEIGELPLGVPQNLVPYLTQTAAGIRKQLTVFGSDYPTPDGSCIRDYIDVTDLAKAHVKAIERILEVKSKERLEYFNLGTGKGLSVLELIQAFEKATGVTVNYKLGERRVGDIEKVWGDVTRANEVLGWKAIMPIEETMANTWKWQQKLQKQL